MTGLPNLIAELRALEAKAGVERWEVEPDYRVDMDHNNHIVVEGTDGVLRVCFMAHGGRERQDEFDAKAALIAAMRNALPVLLDALEERQKDSSLLPRDDRSDEQETVNSFLVPMRPDLAGDATQVIAHALAEATLKGRGVEVTERAVSLEVSHHYRQAIQIVGVFPWYEPMNAHLLACVDHIQGALCNYVNGCGDSFEPVSEWDEESENNFRGLCKAYNDWYDAAIAHKAKGDAAKNAQSSTERSKATPNFPPAPAEARET